jgi:RNA polymerase sigma factor (sigma-70 family)
MKISDREIINGILSNDSKIIQYFWFEQCTPVFHYIIYKVLDRQAEKNELINELHLYLQADDWYKLRQFNYRSSLTTWVRVVAIRFFQKKRNRMIENDSPDTLYTETAVNSEERIHQKLDVESLVEKLPNEKYRFVIRKLILEDKEPQELADKMGITVDNLYNIKRRALVQLARIAGKEDAYVG